jgi:hypothetical protein
MSNLQSIQKAELAGKTKLTLVRMGHGSHTICFFANLHHDSRGKAILPHDLLNRYLNELSVRRGQTWWHG